MSLIPLRMDQSIGLVSHELVVGHSILKSGIVCVGESGIDEKSLSGDRSMDDRGSPGLERNTGNTHVRGQN